MRKPKLGDTVLYKIPGSIAGQEGSCPAVITAVCSDICVNLHLHRDFDQSSTMLSQGDYPTSVIYDESPNDRTWRFQPVEELPDGQRPATVAELSDVREQLAELEQRLALLAQPASGTAAVAIVSPPPAAIGG